MQNFADLAGPTFNPAEVHPSVVRFYEETNSYELDAWAEWCGVFRPFGWLLAVLFSRRLQQLNVPLSGLDTSRGLTNEVLRFVDPATRRVHHTAWYRRLVGSGNNLYAGFCSVCHLPGRADPCVKVVIPLPNGNAIVLMRTERHPDGSFTVVSSGEGFAAPGFYFTADRGPGLVWARYVRSLQESVHVHPSACCGRRVLLFYDAGGIQRVPPWTHEIVSHSNRKAPVGRPYPGAVENSA